MSANFHVTNSSSSPRRHLLNPAAVLKRDIDTCVLLLTVTCVLMILVLNYKMKKLDFTVSVFPYTTIKLLWKNTDARKRRFLRVYVVAMRPQTAPPLLWIGGENW